MKKFSELVVGIFFFASLGFFLAAAIKTSPFRTLRPGFPAAWESLISREHKKSTDGSHWLIRIAKSDSGLTEDFWIDQIPVTMQAYQNCVNSGDCPPTQHRGYFRRYAEALRYRLNPVTYVSWSAAMDYCSHLGGTLPSAAQWMAAAGNGSAKKPAKYPWGDDEPNLSLANFDGYYQGLTPAGWLPKGASPFGVLDLGGNVREWVADAYAQTDKQPPAADVERVLKGGGSSDFGSALEIESFQWHSQNSAGFNRGFRCVYPAE